MPRIARAASNTATGRTVAPREQAPSQSVRPHAPMNLRSVAFSSIVADGDGDLPALPTADNQGLYFYWNTPGNFVSYPDVNGAADLKNWAIEVQRVVPNDSGGSKWIGVRDDEVTVPTNYAMPQFAVDFGDDAEIDEDSNQVRPAPATVGNLRQQRAIPGQIRQPW